MRSSNPVLTGRGFARINPDVLGNRGTDSRDLNSIESRPSSAPMSIDDVVIKTAGLFAVLLADFPQSNGKCRSDCHSVSSLLYLYSLAAPLHYLRLNLH